MTEKIEQKFTEMSLGDHLEELRARVILALLGIAAALAICMFFARFFLSLMAKPYIHALQQVDMEPMLQAISLSEKFMVYMKTGLLFGIVFSSPWVIYQLWQFISAGLYPKERKLVYFIAPVCTVLFITGAAFYLFLIAPIVIKFFVSFDTGIKFVQTQVTLDSYINFMISMTFVFAITFQMPVAIVAANWIGIVSLENLKKVRKYVLLAIFIIAAIVTPPDVISQIALAVPLYILYELAIVFCILTRKKIQ
ncbi:MAG: twin-arginine translocase subunit TatC [Phycisphaerae bacterium]